MKQQTFIKGDWRETWLAEHGLVGSIRTCCWYVTPLYSKETQINLGIPFSTHTNKKLCPSENTFSMQVHSIQVCGNQNKRLLSPLQTYTILHYIFRFLLPGTLDNQEKCQWIFKTWFSPYDLQVKATENSGILLYKFISISCQEILFTYI